ncbi:hypothetical protein FF38_04115 [Lucilia cuprina]|uniref:Uncharacterized protein n=1 Tax=Lucilia cuprina TaxID=7375 RepID=A0A0L0BRT6_LUCCU|nr:hypothetical protein FF38_04115 [Lucilia cuprina]
MRLSDYYFGSIRFKFRTMSSKSDSLLVSHISLYCLIKITFYCATLMSNVVNVSETLSIKMNLAVKTTGPVIFSTNIPLMNEFVKPTFQGIQPSLSYREPSQFLCQSVIVYEIWILLPDIIRMQLIHICIVAHANRFSMILLRTQIMFENLNFILLTHSTPVFWRVYWVCADVYNAQ